MEKGYQRQYWVERADDLRTKKVSSSAKYTEADIHDASDMPHNVRNPWRAKNNHRIALGVHGQGQANSGRNWQTNNLQRDMGPRKIEERVMVNHLRIQDVKLPVLWKLNLVRRLG